VTKLVEENEFLGRNPMEKFLVKSGLTSISKLVKDNSQIVQERITRKWEESKQMAAEKSDVLVEFAPYVPLDSTLDLSFGFLNGMVDVFPATSLPQRCRSNTTTIYYAIKNLFVDSIFLLPAEDVEFTYEI